MRRTGQVVASGTVVEARPEVRLEVRRGEEVEEVCLAVGAASQAAASASVAGRISKPAALVVASAVVRRLEVS